jgi:hypothetical protein
MSEDKDTVAMKLAVIDAACGIKSLEEPELFKRLEQLYLKGFMASSASIEPIMGDLVRQLGGLAAAHVTGNKERVDELLGDFCKRHVVVRDLRPGAEQPKVH